MNWRDYFTQDELLEAILEYLLGDPGYMGLEIDSREIVGEIPNHAGPGRVGNPVIDAFNARHAGKRVMVEWGIGGVEKQIQNLSGDISIKTRLLPCLFPCGCHHDKFYSSTSYGNARC